MTTACTRDVRKHFFPASVSEEPMQPTFKTHPEWYRWNTTLFWCHSVCACKTKDSLFSQEKQLNAGCQDFKNCSSDISIMKSSFLSSLAFPSVKQTAVKPIKWEKRRKTEAWRESSRFSLKIWRHTMLTDISPYSPAFCMMFNLHNHLDYIMLNGYVHSSSYLFNFVAFFGNF